MKTEVNKMSAILLVVSLFIFCICLYWLAELKSKPNVIHYRYTSTDSTKFIMLYKGKSYKINTERQTWDCRYSKKHNKEMLIDSIFISLEE